MLESAGRKKQCMRCGYSWKPRVSDPKQCPQCKSRIWAEAQTTKPDGIKSVLIYGDEHSHYSYHYHIDTVPSFSQSQLLDLLMEALKAILKIDVFDSNHQEWTSENYRLTPDRVLRRKADGYSERILQFSDPEHIHIFFYTDEGRDLFIQAMKQCFPNAEISQIDINDSELEAKRERWRLSGKYQG